MRSTTSITLYKIILHVCFIQSSDQCINSSEDVYIKKVHKWCLNTTRYSCIIKGYISGTKNKEDKN